MPKYLRPEARPADWRSLDEAQQKAFRQVVERATEAIETIPDPKLRREARLESTHWLSEDRTSRTVFLSGARGTGKTTVMMSLIKASTEESGEAVRKSFPEDLHYGLNLMRQRALWLEPVDMASPSPSANLLAAFMARIEEVIYRLCWRSRCVRSPSVILSFKYWPFDRGQCSCRARRADMS
jgi:predicted ATPase